MPYTLPSPTRAEGSCPVYRQHSADSSMQGAPPAFRSRHQTAPCSDSAHRRFQRSRIVRFFSKQCVKIHHHHHHHHQSLTPFLIFTQHQATHAPFSPPQFHRSPPLPDPWKRRRRSRGRVPSGGHRSRQTITSAAGLHGEAQGLEWDLWSASPALQGPGAGPREMMPPARDEPCSSQPTSVLRTAMGPARPSPDSLTFDLAFPFITPSPLFRCRSFTRTRRDPPPPPPAQFPPVHHASYQPLCIARISQGARAPNFPTCRISPRPGPTPTEPHTPTAFPTSRLRGTPTPPRRSRPVMPGPRSAAPQSGTRSDTWPQLQGATP